MRLHPIGRGILVAACAALLHTAGGAANPPREHLSLDFNWRFYLGDEWPNALNLAKAAASTGPASTGFNDTSWRLLNLPHDWAVELPFDRTADVSHGFKPVGPGFPDNSVGWYRRVFELPREDAGKRLWLTFDGAFRDVTLWVNGWFVEHHESGYYPFRVDITDIAHCGGRNVVTVRVDASRFEGWFYEGAGIYRHVWLDKTAPVALAPDGLFVWSEFAHNTPDGSPKIHVESRLLNTQTHAVKATVNCEILSPDGRRVARFRESETVQGESERTVKLRTRVASPVLWSPESPALYRLITTVAVDGREMDRQETRFGIRTVAFDPVRGFLLNGRAYVLKGTCNHQDHAGVGVALPDALQYFRIAKLKEFGCNAYRCSHNPPTPELLEACDRLGMIVMDENRLLGSDAHNLDRLAGLVRRDRNHPSVCMWCIANEEHAVQATAAGGRVGTTMQRLIRQLDPTRPVTAAENVGNTYTGLMGALEVRGWNYWVGTNMDNYHAAHPDQPNVGTEQGSTVCTRGIYQNDKPRGYVSAYDENFPRWASTAEAWWSYFAVRPWLSGGFVWTGFDYRGEPTPYAWPCINSHFGILDTCGFPKDNAYYYKAWWTTNVVLHLLPHWNWPGREGQEIRVDALSNCEEVELFLNGESLGKQTMKPNSKLTWRVKYRPGTLSARGYSRGRPATETSVETTGEPVSLQLTRDPAGASRTAASTPRTVGDIRADGEDAGVFTVCALDAQGRVVPVAQNLVHFGLTGPGRILGVGNGDPSCHEPDVYFAHVPVQNIAVNDWRWEPARVPNNGGPLPEYAPEFDDSTWNVIRPKTDEATGDQVLRDRERAVFRAHVNITEQELEQPGIRVRFGGIDDDGWVFVNNHYVGESHNWQDQPVFDIKAALHPGDNVIAVGVRNRDGVGGLNSDVNVEIVGQPVPAMWSRSLFNGFAQVIVQSTREAGELTLTASADGLETATVTVRSVPGPPRPVVP